MTKKYNKTAVGGTFDHLHKGHQHLLNTAINHAEEIILGVTTEAMVKNKVFTQSIESHDQRVQSLHEYLSTHPANPKYTIVPLSDPFGPTLTDPQIQSITVTHLTLPGAHAVNQKRFESNQTPLAIDIADLISDQSGQYLSSSRIRQGKVNRQGHVYVHHLQNSKQFSDAAKNLLKSPQGQLIKTDDIVNLPFNQYTQIALLGDQVTEHFITRNLPFNYAIIDYKIQRQPHQTQLGNWQPIHKLEAENPPGTISMSSNAAINHLLTQPSGQLTITGEEDLLGFPLAICMPLNSAILYGQPGEGVVLITVTEAEKERLVKLIDHETNVQ